jgi:hypothetical protein
MQLHQIEKFVGLRARSILHINIIDYILFVAEINMKCCPQPNFNAVLFEF